MFLLILLLFILLLYSYVNIDCDIFYNKENPNIKVFDEIPIDADF